MVAINTSCSETRKVPCLKKNYSYFPFWCGCCYLSLEFLSGGVLLQKFVGCQGKPIHVSPHHKQGKISPSQTILVFRHRFWNAGGCTALNNRVRYYYIIK